MAEATELGWRLVWRARGEPVSALHMTGGLAVVARGPELGALAPDAARRWSRRFGAPVHGLAGDGRHVAVLAGLGLHVIDVQDGRSVAPGRAVTGGLRSVLPRPGGGWLGLGRDDRLHLFDEEAVSEVTLNPGAIRRLLGWHDRDSLLVHADDGRIRRVSVSGAGTATLDDRNWSWASPMADGQLLLCPGEPELWQGQPGRQSWDALRSHGHLPADPMAAVTTRDGWWLLGIDARLHRLPLGPMSFDAAPADLLSGARSADLVTASHSGVVQWWSAPRLGALAAVSDERDLGKDRLRYRADRVALFDAARRGEDEQAWAEAARFYQLLGRADDVARMAQAEAAEDARDAAEAAEQGSFEEDAGQEESRDQVDDAEVSR